MPCVQTGDFAEGENKKKEDIVFLLPGSVLVLPSGYLQAIFAAGVLNFCVRDGYRCVHSAIATGSAEDVPSKPDNSFYRFLSFHQVAFFS